MTLIPNPILIDTTPAGGLTLTVTAGRGGLSGYQLLGLDGPSATIELSSDGATWAAVTYPHTLVAGEWLRLTRTDTSAALSVLRALAPEDTGSGGEEGTIQNGVPITGLSARESSTPGQSVRPTFSFSLPAGTARLTLQVSGGSGARDVFARQGSDPDPVASSTDDAPSTEHTVIVDNPVAGAWTVDVMATMVGGEGATDFTLTVSW